VTRDHIHSELGPAAIGPYSQGVWAGELLFLSGQTPIDPATGRLVEGDAGDQTRRVFDNLEAVLSGAGLTMHDVVKCNVFLATMDDFPAMNEVYAERFEAPFPARSTVAVAGLPLGARVEIELVARRP
jgi:2-iminobutanoate/2-iminopropanoate deaminase